MSVQTQNSALRQVALVQARQLREHADKAPHNDFVDHFLNSRDFQDSAILKEKVVASRARILPKTVVGAEGRFALLQGCFEAAVGGSLAANPGCSGAGDGKADLGGTVETEAGTSTGDESNRAQ